MLDPSIASTVLLFHDMCLSFRIGIFEEAAETLQQRLHVILETPAEPADPDPLHMIRTFYETCKDTGEYSLTGTLLIKTCTGEGQEIMKGIETC